MEQFLVDLHAAIDKKAEAIKGAIQRRRRDGTYDFSCVGTIEGNLKHIQGLRG